MAIVIRSGLLAAVGTVQQYLTDNGVTAKVEVGWKRIYRQDNQSVGGGNRVVFIPSDKGALAARSRNPSLWAGGTSMMQTR